jgi:hypothetical protein
MLLWVRLASWLGIRCRKLVSWVAISLKCSFQKPFPPGRSVLTAVGLASPDVESSPVSIHVEREDSVIELQVQPPLPSFAELGDKFPLRVRARFAEGSNLGVTHSGRVYIHTENSRDCQSR